MMANNTKIEWTDATWNIVTGCEVVSPGCTNCYAMKLAGTRLKHHPSRAGLTKPSRSGPVWTGEVRFNDGWLEQPLRWRKPRRIFVAAHGDLFHENVPDEVLDKVFAIMALCPQHQFQVLTKRPERMREYLTPKGRHHAATDYAALIAATGRWNTPGLDLCLWPLPNVWLGVSVEDQQRADERVPALLKTPAAKRFISAEPLLGPVDLTFVKNTEYWRVNALRGARWGHAPGTHGECSALDWVIVGGESQSGARPMHPDWARGIRDQCAEADVPFFFKQWGEWGPDDGPRANGRDPVLEAAVPAAWHDGTWHVAPSGYEVPLDESEGHGEWVYRFGKKATGRALDGRTHDEMPS